MRLQSAELRHALAAEYVLGTLRGAARRRFERTAEGDAGLRGIVAEWERYLTPLAERVAPVEPPARVWKAIEARLARNTPSPAPAAGGWWSSLALWRGVGLGASGLAAALLVAFTFFLSGPADQLRAPVFVSVLAAADQKPRMVVSMHKPDTLLVRVVAPWTQKEDKELELWVLPKNGAPRSLGLLPISGEKRIRITTADARMADASGFSVSVEPHGGSPSGAPTGPVLCSGAIAPLRT